MYCSHCGREIDDKAAICIHCGSSVADVSDSSSKGFAILGFFIPLLGLILYLVYEGKQPKKAKSAGKGALIGFITGIIFTIIFVILYVVCIGVLIGNVASNSSELHNQYEIMQNELDEDINNLKPGNKTDEILQNYINVEFGEFSVKKGEVFNETKLPVTVENLADKKTTFYVTIEAVDEDGTRLTTDMLLVDRLNSGQKINLNAFEFVDEELLDDLKTAEFKVLEIEMYNW